MFSWSSCKCLFYLQKYFLILVLESFVNYLQMFVNRRIFFNYYCSSSLIGTSIVINDIPNRFILPTSSTLTIQQKQNTDIFRLIWGYPSFALAESPKQTKWVHWKQNELGSWYIYIISRALWMYIQHMEKWNYNYAFKTIPAPAKPPYQLLFQWW